VWKIFFEDGQCAPHGCCYIFHSHRLYAVLIILYLKFTIYASLEEERDALKSSIDKLQNNLQMVNVLKQERKGVAN
jgi:hypothetical protein